MSISLGPIGILGGDYLTGKSNWSNAGKPARGSSDSLAVTLAVLSTIQIYPNPTDDMVNVTCPCVPGGLLRINITDVTGRLIYTNTTICGIQNSTLQTIDISACKNGMYIVDATVDDQHATEKVIKY